jgi:catecholate siderophore receptor
VTLGSHQYRRVVADFNLKTGDDAALRINAMRTLADNNGAGSSLDKYGFAADYRWGIGSRRRVRGGLLLPGQQQRHQLRPALHPQERHRCELTTIPVDPKSYYGMASDYNRGSAGYASFAHTHRFWATPSCVTKVRARATSTATSAPAPCASPAPRLQPGGAAVATLQLQP